jgi:hypothetical protein
VKFWKKEKKLIMLNIDNLFFFIFIFSVLVVLRTTVRLIGALSQNSDVRVLKSDRELIFLGLTVSYIITYLFN